MKITFAYFVLVLWVPLSQVFYAALHPRLATVALVLCGTLLLPGRIAVDAPLVPSLGREELSGLAAGLGGVLFARRFLLSRLPATGLDVLALVFLAGGMVTALTNPDPLRWGRTVLPALSAYDGISMAAEHLLTLWIPFYLGRTFFRTPRDLRLLLSWLAIAATAYSALVFVELWISPQLHRLVYGYHLMHYVAARRWWGWRPTVFMEHGLALALFMLSTAMGAIGLARARFRILGFRAGIVAAYLIVVMVLCKGLAIVVYGLAAVPIVLWARPRTQLRIAAVVASLVLAYPLLRTVGAVPTQLLVETARTVSADRAQSLEFRFDNEDLLLDWARQRIWFGWGKWSRHRVFEERTGRDISITDGFWIVILGQLGLVGFVSILGMLILPVWLALLRLPRIRSRRDRALVAATAWIVTVNGVDLLPNAMLTPASIFVSGALAGAVEGLAGGRRRFRAARARRRRAGSPGRGVPPAEARGERREPGHLRGPTRYPKLVAGGPEERDR